MHSQPLGESSSDALVRPRWNRYTRSVRALSLPSLACLLCVHAACTEPVCGNGIVEGNETCDDGTHLFEDGCRQCETTPGYVCTPGEECSPICGDRRLVAAEVCDPTVHAFSEYCSEDCSMLIARCGDGTRQTSVELCDDGNTDDGDGCATTCRASFGFTCEAATGECDASDVARDATGNTMTNDQKRDLCEWLIATMGGAGRYFYCNGAPYRVNDLSTCMGYVDDDLGHCTVGDFERWIAVMGSPCAVATAQDVVLCEG